MAQPHFVLALALFGHGAKMRAGVDLRAFDSIQQRAGHTADLRCDRLHTGPQQRILTAMILHETYRTLAHFGRKFVLLAHG